MTGRGARPGLATPAAPRPRRDPAAPLTGAPQDRPPLPPVAPETRRARLAQYWSSAVQAGPSVADGSHGEIQSLDGTPSGIQTSWDGPRRGTFRVTPRPWAEGLVVTGPLPEV